MNNEKYTKNFNNLILDRDELAAEIKRYAISLIPMPEYGGDLNRFLRRALIMNATSLALSLMNGDEMDK